VVVCSLYIYPGGVGKEGGGVGVQVGGLLLAIQADVFRSNYLFNGQSSLFKKIKNLN